MRIDIAEVKSKNALEDVIRETGWMLEEQPDQPGKLVGKDEPGLVVDTQRQYYELGDERGDVLAWLCKRFGWTFGQAARYLHYRSGLSVEQRQSVLKPSDVAKVERKTGKVGKIWPGVQEKLARQLWKDLQDYDGIERLLRGSSTEAIMERAWIPSRFIPMLGDLSGELCSCCYREPKGWEEGQWFYQFELSGDYQIMDSSGVYCSDCVAKFKRWNTGFARLIAILVDQERQPVSLAGSLFCATA